MATIWLQIGGGHTPKSVERQLYDSDIPFLAGSHWLSREEAMERTGRRDPALERAVKSPQAALPSMGWSYFHAEQMRRRNANAVVGRFAKAGATVVLYIDIPTWQARDFLSDAKRIFDGENGAMVVWYNRRQAYRGDDGSPVVYYSQAVEDEIIAGSNYVTAAMIPKWSQMQEAMEFIERHNPSPLRADPVKALARFAQWTPGEPLPLLADLTDPDWSAKILSGECEAEERRIAERWRDGQPLPLPIQPRPAPRTAGRTPPPAAEDTTPAGAGRHTVPRGTTGRTSRRSRSTERR